MMVMIDEESKIKKNEKEIFKDEELDYVYDYYYLSESPIFFSEQDNLHHYQSSSERRYDNYIDNDDYFNGADSDLDDKDNENYRYNDYPDEGEFSNDDTNSDLDDKEDKEDYDDEDDGYKLRNFDHDYLGGYLEDDGINDNDENEEEFCNEFERKMNLKKLRYGQAMKNSYFDEDEDDHFKDYYDD